MNCDPLLDADINTAFDVLPASQSSLVQQCSAQNCLLPSGKFFTFPTCSSKEEEARLDVMEFPKVCLCCAFFVSFVTRSQCFRCKVWVKNSGNCDLLGNVLDLNGSMFLCASHFEASQFSCAEKQILVHNAVPTLIDALPLTDEQVTNAFQEVEDVLECKKGFSSFS